MGVGDLNQFTKFQTANAIEAAANNLVVMQALVWVWVWVCYGKSNGTIIKSTASFATANSASMPPAIQYFVAVNGQQTGPFTLQVLQQMVMKAN